VCLIIDANLASRAFSQPPHRDFRPVVDWLTLPRYNGRLVVGGKLSAELFKLETARKFLVRLNQAGRARVIADKSLEPETHAIASRCRSNDHHVIALARVGGARLLCSHDKKLHSDFTNPELISDPKGRIYQTAEHAHLLRQFGHTKACRGALRAGRK